MFDEYDYLSVMCILPRVVACHELYKVWNYYKVQIVVMLASFCFLL